MTTETENSVSAAEYKAQLLKKNFADRVANYEDLVAELQTKLALANQQIRELMEPKEAQPTAAAPPPPAPEPPTAPVVDRDEQLAKAKELVDADFLSKMEE